MTSFATTPSLPLRSSEMYEDPTKLLDMVNLLQQPWAVQQCTTALILGNGLTLTHASEVQAVALDKSAVCCCN